MSDMRDRDHHRTNMRVHAMRRLFERHGIAITNAEFGQMVADIHDGRSPVLGLARRGGTLHLITIHGRSVYAVWDLSTACIATFLPGGVPWELRYPKIAQAIA